MRESFRSPSLRYARIKPTLMIQLDKSTCQIKNSVINEFGYLGVLNTKSSTFLNQIEQDFNIKACAEVQFTHGFDVNAQDAQYHSSLKFELKNGPMLNNNDEIQILFDETVEKTNQPRTIQKGFIRAYRRNKYGDRNDSLIPQDIMDWYSDDELSSDSDASAD